MVDLGLRKIDTYTPLKHQNIMKYNSELRASARENSRGHWAQPVIATLIYAVLIFVLSITTTIPYIGWICIILLGAPLLYAYI